MELVFNLSFYNETPFNMTYTQCLKQFFSVFSFLGLKLVFYDSLSLFLYLAGIFLVGAFVVNYSGVYFREKEWGDGITPKLGGWRGSC